jgi:hypothetical protein
VLFLKLFCFPLFFLAIKVIFIIGFVLAFITVFFTGVVYFKYVFAVVSLLGYILGNWTFRSL